LDVLLPLFAVGCAFLSTTDLLRVSLASNALPHFELADQAPFPLVSVCWSMMTPSPSRSSSDTRRQVRAEARYEFAIEKTIFRKEKTVDSEQTGGLQNWYGNISTLVSLDSWQMDLISN
jgi:hypothetical protein